MGKNAVKSVRKILAALGGRNAVEGYPVPASPQDCATFEGGSANDNGHMVPRRRKPGRRALLDGNFARRNLLLRETEYCIWDTELAGFGLRVRPSGNYFWFVRLRHRGKHRRITLGRTDELDAGLARAQARRLLAEVALDGLPKRAVVKATPLLSDFVDTHWDDLSRIWKASTTRRNLQAWRRALLPEFGAMRVADILPADIHRWRDSCAGPQEGHFNRALPVLASLLKYAEALRLRRKGSNPCRGMPRYWREPKERFLTPAEYRRIGAALREEEAVYPAQVAALRLLLFTGARVGEIMNLRWEWVQPPRLLLPDSKTGAKTIWLNSQALAVLDGISQRDGMNLSSPISPVRSPSSSKTGGCHSGDDAHCPMSASTICGTASLRPRSWTTSRSRRSGSCSAMSCRKRPRNMPTFLMM